MSVCPSFESNIRQNGWSNWAQFFCGTWHDPINGLCMIKMSKISLHQNWIFIKLLKPTNKIFKLFLLFYILNKEKMLTMEAPWNPSNLNKSSISSIQFWICIRLYLVKQEKCSIQSKLVRLHCSSCGIIDTSLQSFTLFIK